MDFLTFSYIHDVLENLYDSLTCIRSVQILQLCFKGDTEKEWEEGLEVSEDMSLVLKDNLGILEILHKREDSG